MTPEQGTSKTLAELNFEHISFMADDLSYKVAN